MEKNISQTADTDRIRVLVVDDDPGMLEITVLLLNHQGYLATPATGSKEAITRIKETPDGFDAVLTDYGMPVINGIELAGMIKELPVDIPVILYTGKIDYIDETRLARIGITDIAQKPCKIDKLDSVIKKAVNKKRAQPDF